MKTKGSTYDLIVIGGGPSGMMAAGRAAELGAKVLLIEKNKKLGKKLGITGGGRCNITNAEPEIRTFLENFGDAKEFLFSPFSKFSQKDTLEFFENKGLPLIIESRKRAFPNTHNAEDVINVMETYIRENDVEVHMKAKVTSLIKNEDDIFEVSTKKNTFFAANVVIATGGLAAPETGSTGDGFKFLEDLGHTVLEPNPNIVPLRVNEDWVQKLSGVTLSFMKIRFIQDGKIKITKVGKILFTHFGISGPLILNTSYEVKKLLEKGRVTASIDIFPDTEENELEKRILNLFEKNKNKMVKNIFTDILPKSISETVLSLPDINLAEREVNSITREERKKLIKKIKGLDFEIAGTMGFDRAVIADGGVIPEEVDFKNMTSRKIKNLYLLGDILDINRPSGGFSLQLCWTTGWVAGTDIGTKVSKAKAS